MTRYGAAHTRMPANSIVTSRTEKVPRPITLPATWHTHPSRSPSARIGAAARPRVVPADRHARLTS